MKYFYFIFILSLNAEAFSLIGHRVVAGIAQEYLDKNSKKNIEKILGTQVLVDIANEADELKGNLSYKHTKPWHYVNWKNHKDYLKKFKKKGKGKKNKADIISALYHLEEVLVNTKSSKLQKRMALIFIVHFLGDLHQPLHIGLASDRGGNLIKLNYFSEPSNLHKVWDKDLIQSYELSHREFKDYLIRKYSSRKDFIKTLSAAGDQHYFSWAVDTRKELKEVYTKDKNLKYRYLNKHKERLEKQMFKGGFRLALALNSIFSKNKTALKSDPLKKHFIKNSSITK